MGLEGTSARVFDDLFDKGVDDVKDALTRTSRLMAMEEPKGNAGALLVIGVLTSCYAAALSATRNAVSSKGLPGDYVTAAAVVETFDKTLVSIIDDLRTLVATGMTMGGEIAEALASVDDLGDAFKMEETISGEA